MVSPTSVSVNPINLDSKSPLPKDHLTVLSFSLTSILSYVSVHERDPLPVSNLATTSPRLGIVITSRNPTRFLERIQLVLSIKN